MRIRGLGLLACRDEEQGIASTLFLPNISGQAVPVVTVLAKLPVKM